MLEELAAPFAADEIWPDPVYVAYGRTLCFSDTVDLCSYMAGACC